MPLVVRAEYPASYRDSYGSEPTTIEECFSAEEQGTLLRMLVRGELFIGTNLWSLASAAQAHLPWHERAALRSFAVRFAVPVPEDTPSGVYEGSLQIDLAEGDRGPSGNWEGDHLDIHLVLDEHTYRLPDTCVADADLEVALSAIDVVLPADFTVHVCVNCRLSDRNPIGGPLACFRGNKEAFRRVLGKAERFRIWPTLTEYVQEFWHCPEFERAP